MARVKKIEERESPYMTFGSYDYDGLAHWFAYNSGRRSTANDRMSCANEVCYSYNTAIARMYNNRDKSVYLPVVLVSDKRWSNTTKKHIDAVLSAVSHMAVVMVKEVSPYSKSAHEENLKYFLEKLIAITERYLKSRRENTREDRLVEYLSTMRMAHVYAYQFRLKSNVIYKDILSLGETPSGKVLSDIEVIERRVENRRKRKINKLAEERIKENKKRAEKANSDLEKWLSGEEDRIPNMDYIEDPFIRLRIKGAVIETTNHASISLKSAIAAFKKYKEGTLKRGDEISGFIFDGISDGIAKVGCHNIKLEVVEKLFNGVGV